MTNFPTKTGFFWGRWHTPAPGTADDGEMCLGTEWEVHSVFRTGFGSPDDELVAFVPGVEKSQPIDAFEWGEEVVRHAVHPEMPIHQRRALIAEALAKVLDRGLEMSVEATGPSGTDLGVWVIRDPYDDSRIAHEIDDIARELEVLL